MRRVAALIGLTLALWLVLAYPAQRLGGTQALVYSALAMALCLLPSVATLVLADRARHTASGNPLLALLGGTAVRMFVVLGAGLVLSLWVLPALPEIMSLWAEPSVTAFWLWVLLFYLSTLAMEVGLLLTSSPARGEQ